MFEKDIVIFNFCATVFVKMTIVCSRFASAPYNVFNRQKPTVIGQIFKNAVIEVYTPIMLRYRTRSPLSPAAHVPLSKYPKNQRASCQKVLQ